MVASYPQWFNPFSPWSSLNLLPEIATYKEKLMKLIDELSETQEEEEVLQKMKDIQLITTDLLSNMMGFSRHFSRYNPPCVNNIIVMLDDILNAKKIEYVSFDDVSSKESVDEKIIQDIKENLENMFQEENKYLPERFGKMIKNISSKVLQTTEPEEITKLKDVIGLIDRENSGTIINIIDTKIDKKPWYSHLIGLVRGKTQ